MHENTPKNMNNISTRLKLELNHMRFHAVIGAYAWEKVVNQPVIIDLEIVPGNAAAAVKTSDHLEDAIDYVTIHTHIQHILKKQRFELIEAASEYLVQSLLHTFNIDAIKLRLQKPLALNQRGNVCVIVEYKHDGEVE